MPYKKESIKQINTKNCIFLLVAEKLFFINGNTNERIKSTGKLPIEATINATIKKNALLKSPKIRNHISQPIAKASEDKIQILADSPSVVYSFFIFKSALFFKV
jgi:hypothetical protein